MSGVESPSIVFDHVCFDYGKGVQVLHDINLELSGPGLICIIGPNGVGKSTLIKCINGILEPTSGRVEVDGLNVADTKTKDLAKFMSYVPVTTQDCFSMPVMDTVLMGRYGKSKWRTSQEDLDATYRTLELVGMEDYAMRGFNELSAGQHQKIALARGLVKNPQILILDEPTSNLDVRHQVHVTEILREIAQQCGMMVVMISHDLNVSAKYADKVIVMSEPGRIYAVGSPQDVITEDTVRDVYGVDCEIIYRNGRPHVILGSALE